MITTQKRLQQAVFEGLASMNRDYGSGGGSGNLPLLNLGIAQGSPGANYSTANASAFTAITGSSFTAQVNRPTLLLYLCQVTLDGTLTAGGNAYIRGRIVNFDTTQVPQVFLPSAAGAPRNLSIWYISPYPVPPALYTVQLEIATDAGITVTVTQFTNQIFDLGA